MVVPGRPVISQLPRNNTRNSPTKGITTWLLPPYRTSARTLPATSRQATELTIKALKEAQGGEVFVLKMPVIVLGDLVDIVLEETCNNYNINPRDIEVKIMGVRPGEKMYEELMTYDESRSALELTDMYIIPGKTYKEEYYCNTKKASIESYSSMNRATIKSYELRELLKKADLL